MMPTPLPKCRDCGNEPVRIIVGDVIDGLRTLPDRSVHCAVTSPPYWGLRDYGCDGQIGLESTPDAFVAKMVEVFREVRRVLRDDGSLWLNLGDSYNGSGPSGGAGKQYSNVGSQGTTTKRVDGLKTKDLCMIPWRVALALQADGWYLRSVIVWAKKSPMPESVTDRPTSSWEPIFLLTKNDRYFYDAEAVKENTEGPPDIRDRASNFGKQGKVGGHLSGNPIITNYGRNQRNVWHLGPEPYAEAHFATFVTEIPRRAIKAGTSEKGCCSACGAPWTRIVSKTQIKRERPNELTKRSGAKGTGKPCANTVAGVETRTTGWKPGCECNAGDPAPCVVLDPFLGSGTTVAVARTLGRHGVGCELNPEYAELARVRIGKAEKPGTFMDTRVRGDAPLFQGSMTPEAQAVIEGARNDQTKVVAGGLFEGVKV